MTFSTLAIYIKHLEEIVDNGSDQHKKIARNLLNRDVTAHNTDEIEEYLLNYQRNR